MCCTECTLSVRYSCCYNMNHWKRMTWHWVAKLRPAIFSRALLDPLRLNLARSSHYSIAWFSDASVRIPPKAVFFVPAAQLPPLPPCPQHFPWSTPTFRSCRPLAGLLPASCRQHSPCNMADTRVYCRQHYSPFLPPYRSITTLTRLPRM